MNEEIYQRILANNRKEAAARQVQEDAPTPEPEAVDTTSMADFAQQHRGARLPRVQRQNELVQKQRDALYGHDEQRLRDWRGR